MISYNGFEGRCISMKKLFFISSLALLLGACSNEETLPKEKPLTDEVEHIQETQISNDEIKVIIEDYGLGEEDELISLSVKNGEIKATIDLASSEFNLPLEDMAVTSYSQISDTLLEEEGWNTLTIEYVDIGTISMNISEKEMNELDMPYFPTATITERLK